MHPISVVESRMTHDSYPDMQCIADCRALTIVGLLLLGLIGVGIPRGIPRGDQLLISTGIIVPFLVRTIVPVPVHTTIVVPGIRTIRTVHIRYVPVPAGRDQQVYAVEIRED